MFATINNPDSLCFSFVCVRSEWQAKLWIAQKEEDAKKTHGAKWREVITESAILSDREFASLVGERLYLQYSDELYFL